jgi:nitroreductase
MGDEEGERYWTAPTFAAYPREESRSYETVALAADGSTELAPSDAVLSAAAFAMKPRTAMEIKSHLVGNPDLSLDESAVEQLVFDLVDSGVLEGAEEGNRPRRQWFEKNWAPQFYFHLADRGTASEDGTLHRGENRAEAERTGESVSLPPIEPPTDRSLDEVLFSRRTRRRFDGDTLGVQDLSTVLGVTADESEPLYDVHLVPARVPDLSRRAYRYDPGTHSVVPTTERTFSSPDAVDERVREAAIHQHYAESAAVALFIGFGGETSMTGTEAYVESCLQFGEAAQRILLAAESLGYSGFVTAALDDTTASTLVGVDELSSPPVYLIAIGSPVDETTPFTERVSVRPRIALER